MDFGSDMYIGGGVANSVTVTSGGYLRIYDGGTATNILWTPCVGMVRVEGDAHVTFVSQYSGVYFGSDNQLLSHASVMNGQTVGSSCTMYVMSGGTANYTTVNEYGWLFIYSGGTANNTIFDSCEMHVLNGGVANNVTMRNKSSDADCYLDIYSGGTANRVTVNRAAVLELHSGGTMNSITVNSGGRVWVFCDGRLTGQMTFESGAVVSAYEGAILDFDLTQTSAGASVLVNGLSIIQGTPFYTLTVDGKQASGNYALAEGAAGFDRTISVVNTDGDELGTLTVGQTVTIGGVDYTLNLNYGTLSVEVVSSVVPVPDRTFFTGDFNGDLFDTLAVQSGNVITVYMNGEPWGLCITLDPGWTTVGVGDFSGDGLDDFLRVNTEGYVVGEMSNGNGTFSPQVLNLKNAGWEILGTGDFNGSGSCDVLVANPTGASETVGLLGYWESGVTWTLINGYSPEWECVSTGDFNGDGKCDMLWRNSFEGEGGLTYNAYCTWIMDDPVDWRMVSVANPDEWNFLCSGDFDGNGSHDIAMINDVGVVGIWGVNDGYLSSWSILSAVTSEWTLAGVGDFNADGTDDIAWSNAATGLTGYWQINDKTLTNWANIATIA
jgi:autotransporter passenger strand-loop-strand repeat protein